MVKLAPRSPLVGVGLYTPDDVAGLLQEDRLAVRRWAFGYTRKRGGEHVRYEPLIKTELPELEGERAITFVEMVELMYIRGFVRAGVGWGTVKAAARVAARLFETEHPFAMKKFFADPTGIYAQLEEAGGDESLVQLVGHGQHAIHQLVKPYLGQLEFDPDEVASRWWPMGKMGKIVVDPERSFGAPLVDEIGVPAHVLASAYEAEAAHDPDHALGYVAWLYRVGERHVEAALNFRRWLQTPPSFSSTKTSRRRSPRH